MNLLGQAALVITVITKLPHSIDSTGSILATKAIQNQWAK